MFRNTQFLISLLALLFSVNILADEVSFKVIDKEGGIPSYKDAITGLKLNALSSIKSNVKVTNMLSGDSVVEEFNEYKDGYIQLFNIRKVEREGGVWLVAEYKHSTSNYKLLNISKEIDGEVEQLYIQASNIDRLLNLKNETIDDITLLDEKGIDTSFLKQEVQKINFLLTRYFN
ncbi:hypothetical protein ACMAZF_20460 (plasmid) [Psychrobium sp. nBUS_13]|uniref:hypothetical protein n=1 Tax=Psychrobium sp. nBUS_13 TaxID=3395319 RepID=UPI003EC02274